MPESAYHCSRFLTILMNQHSGIDYFHMALVIGINYYANHSFIGGEDEDHGPGSGPDQAAAGGTSRGFSESAGGGLWLRRAPSGAGSGRASSGRRRPIDDQRDTGRPASGRSTSAGVVRGRLPQRRMGAGLQRARRRQQHLLNEGGRSLDPNDRADPVIAGTGDCVRAPAPRLDGCDDRSAGCRGAEASSEGPSGAWASRGSRWNGGSGACHALSRPAISAIAG